MLRKEKLFLYSGKVKDLKKYIGGSIVVESPDRLKTKEEI